MAILAGIDEAGLGPVVGPLVVSTGVFRLPERIARENLWRLLAGAVTRRSLRRSPALPLADSKTMHVRSDGPVHLERGVLGLLGLIGPPPGGLRELLGRVAGGAAGAMDAYPWYAGADLPLPRWADATDVALRANGAAEAMARVGMSLEAVRAEVLLAGDYNRIVGATRNKAAALFGVTSRLIAYVFGTHAGDDDDGPCRIVVDRQGGRIRYRRHIQRMFEDAELKIVEESDRRSVYLLRARGRAAEVHFLTDGEDACLPVAFASMVSKYLRELFMELLNRYWAARIDGLRPTAGYFVDGRRFLRDIAAALDAEGVDRALLVRSR